MMKLIEKAHLVLYRVCHEGLEVFLVKRDDTSEEWSLPSGFTTAEQSQLPNVDSMIELEPVADDKGQHKSGVAIEGDWHDIPSLKALLQQDAAFVKGKLNEIVPELERNGAFFVVKEALKKVLPQQYTMLRELKEILHERNNTKY